ncbi:MAG TPA: hypothetical protein VGE14_12780 [Marmoricola sp.]
MNSSAADQPSGPGWYEIHLQGRLHPRWSTLLDGMSMTPGADGTTILRGRLRDQAALHGLLGRLRDIGLPLLSIVQADRDLPTGTAGESAGTDGGA